MSSSLRIDKSKSKFAPVGKARPPRRPQAARAKASLAAVEEAPVLETVTPFTAPMTQLDETTTALPMRKEVKATGPTSETEGSIISTPGSTPIATPSASEGLVMEEGTPTTGAVRKMPTLMGPAKRARRGSILGQANGAKGGELEPLDWNKLAVREFCRDTGRGTPTKAAAERARKLAERKRRQEAGEPLEEEEEGQEDTGAGTPRRRSRRGAGADGVNTTSIPPTPTTPSNPEPVSITAPTSMVNFGPRIRINAQGQRIIDETTLSVSHASIVEGGNTGPLDVVMESAANHFSNSSSYTNKEKRGRQWKGGETQRFWEGLAKFGTDFEMIRQKCFQSRVTRAHLKGKFKREDKANPERVTQALVYRRVWIEDDAVSGSGRLVDISEVWQDDASEEGEGNAGENGKGNEAPATAMT